MTPNPKTQPMTLLSVALLAEAMASPRPTITHDPSKFCPGRITRSVAFGSASPTQDLISMLR
jgi:hypothetical protein